MKKIKKPKYKLKDLLSECDNNKEFSQETLDWANDKPVGKEII